MSREREREGTRALERRRREATACTTVPTSANSLFFFLARRARVCLSRKFLSFVTAAASSPSLLLLPSRDKKLERRQKGERGDL